MPAGAALACSIGATHTCSCSWGRWCLLPQDETASGPKCTQNCASQQPAMPSRRPRRQGKRQQGSGGRNQPGALATCNAAGQSRRALTDDKSLCPSIVDHNLRGQAGAVVHAPRPSGRWGAQRAKPGGSISGNRSLHRHTCCVLKTPNVVIKQADRAGRSPRQTFAHLAAPCSTSMHGASDHH